MATSILNKMIIYNKKNKAPLCHCIKKNSCLIQQFYRHCSGTAIFFFFLKKGTLFYVSCSNDNKLKVTFQFPLAKGTFN